MSGNAFLVRVRFALAVALAACTAAAAAQTAPGADWPKGPVHVVVPYGPGSTPDIIARIVGDRLAKRSGQPVIVENKAGAAGNLGTDAIAKAAPDGQTIGVSIAGPLGVNALLFKKMPYDPAKDLELVSIAATQPSVLVVPSTSSHPSSFFVNRGPSRSRVARTIANTSSSRVSR